MHAKSSRKKQFPILYCNISLWTRLESDGPNVSQHRKLKCFTKWASLHVYYETCIYSQQLAVDDSMTPQSYQNSPFNSLIPPPLQNCFYCNLISIDTFVTSSGEDVNFAWVPLYRTCSAYSTKLEIIVTRSILSCLYNTYSTSKSMLLNLHKHMQQQWVFK